jgi:hypothetical protein
VGLRVSVDRRFVPIFAPVRDVRGAIAEELDHAVFDEIPERGPVPRVVGDLTGVPRTEMKDPPPR